MNMKVKRNVILSFATSLLLMLSSCASDVANRYYAVDHYPPKKAKEVEVLYKNPTQPYEVIADFQARDAGEATMRRMAAKIGADAVIVSLLGGSYSGKWAETKPSSSSYSRVTGTAIKYK